MTQHHLDIGELILYDQHTYELSPKRGEISAADVQSYFSFIDIHCQPPYRILLNIHHAVAYSFSAQVALMTDTKLCIYAVVARSKAARYSFEDIYLLRKNPPGYAIFEDYSEALSWLLKVPLKDIV